MKIFPLYVLHGTTWQIVAILVLTDAQWWVVVALVVTRHCRLISCTHLLRQWRARPTQILPQQGGGRKRVGTLLSLTFEALVSLLTIKLTFLRTTTNNCHPCALVDIPLHITETLTSLTCYPTGTSPNAQDGKPHHTSLVRLETSKPCFFNLLPKETAKA